MCQRSRLGSPSEIHSAIDAPDAARARQAVGTETRGYEQAAHLGLPEAELVVRCEGLGSVDHPGDLHVLHLRHTLSGTGHDLLEPFQSSSSNLPLSRAGCGRTQPRRRAGRRAPIDARSRPSRGHRPPRGSRRAGRGRAAWVAGSGSRSRNGCVIRYSCDIGTTGMRTPASRPTSALDIPAAITAVSHSTSPRSVRTRSTRPSRTSMPVTRVEVRIVAPPRRAPSASA